VNVIENVFNILSDFNGAIDVCIHHFHNDDDNDDDGDDDADT